MSLLPRRRDLPTDQADTEGCRVLALGEPHVHDGGIGFRTPLPREAIEALRDPSVALAMVILEDGHPLPLGDAPHAFIRENPGAFSIWGEDAYFSATDGSDCRTNGRTYAVAVPEPGSIQAAHGTFTLSRPFIDDGGLAAAAPLPPEALLAMEADPLLRDCSVVLEDGVALPRPKAQLQSIRERGHGEFCVWGRQVHFSSSDGTDCGANGRRYELLVPEPGTLRAILAGYAARLAGDDRALLGVIQDSVATNNTLFNNFYSQGADALAYLHAAGPISGAAVVLGCGKRPWMPLRLLAEGFDTVVANDLLPVDVGLPAKLAEQFLAFLASVDPVLEMRLRQRAAPREDDLLAFDGLNVRGETLFEQMAIPDESIDFVFSNSVLEHVGDPEAVYGAMWRMLRPGGHAYHVIDLRDHLNYFDPLRFLSMSDGDYAAIDTENRLRASDHLLLARDVGFADEILYLLVLTSKNDGHAPQLEAGRTQVKSWDEVVPALTPDEIQAFDQRFRSHSPEDLSIIGMGVVLRKPTERGRP